MIARCHAKTPDNRYSELTRSAAEGVKVPLTVLQREKLFAGLAIRGWVWREGFIYAPHGTMWLSGSQPWAGDLREFHERMTGRLDRNKQAAWMYEDEGDHRGLVADTRGLVDTLVDMLSAADAEPAPDSARISGPGTA